MKTTSVQRARQYKDGEIMRLIDADALEKAIYKWMPKDQETWTESDIPPIENLVVSIMMTIQEQPTVVAVPVRPGKWIETRGGAYKCSVCGDFWGTEDREMVKGFNYCPYCGTRMEE